MYEEILNKMQIKSKSGERIHMTGVLKVWIYTVKKGNMPSKGWVEKVLLHQITHTSDIQALEWCPAAKKNDPELALEWIKVLSDSSNH